ncbi:MAG: hypothetical protein ABFC89_11830 [Methanospirillum sp.]
MAININCTVLDGNTVRIGDRVLFGPAVQIYTVHRLVIPAERRCDLELTSPVTIGEIVCTGAV